MIFEESGILVVRHEAIPAALKDARRWATWRAEVRSAGPRGLYEAPCGVHGQRGAASATDPATWSDFSSARDAYVRQGARADGLLFASGQGIGCIAIDDCIDPASGDIDQRAREIIGWIGSYSEKSATGRGVRIIVGYPEAKGCCAGNIEVYPPGRFLSVTGHHIAGTPMEVLGRFEPVNLLRGVLASRQKARQAGRGVMLPAGRSALQRASTGLVGHLATRASG